MSAFDLTHMEQLDPAVLGYWRTRTLLGLLYVAGVFVGPLAVFDRARPWLFAALALVTVGVIVASILWPRAKFDRYRFAVDEHELRLRHGVLRTTELVIPVARLQHVDLSRNPFQRAFGLASLVVHTAGGSSATFSLPGLGLARAEQLRDEILDRLPDSVRRPSGESPTTSLR